ncbi:MAG: deoxyguanosinetriphosphate triphosphohydrolase [Clostridiales bacterium]|jgi:dGTPase|nr:deoxyguanosinetriphosphate triphosphohydrolase [Clostridiales bacterium]
MKEEYLIHEENYLSQYAKKSRDAGARARTIEPCPLRSEFQRDRDRILHCKSFRRLKHKTQVFLSPEGDHYRTRLTHTLEVAQIARTAARCLRLNEDLTEAIALGHDLGHTPFGHSGEKTLNELMGHFHHNEQSLRVVEVLENDGQGLNLTPDVRDGILNHRQGLKPATLEGAVVNYSDRIAYINHDIDDAESAGLITEEMLPKECRELFGTSKGERINNLLTDLIENSYEKGVIRLSDRYEEVFAHLRKYMFDNVYENKAVKKFVKKADRMIKLLYDYYIKNPLEIPPSYLKTADTITAVCDYIAAMTDRYAIRKFEELFVPDDWAT